jgi:hypothetical protein
VSQSPLLVPEAPPGFLLQLGRVIVRGSELRCRFREVDTPDTASGKRRIGGRDWLQRSRTALEQRDDVVQNAWMSAPGHPHPDAMLPAEGWTKWTEESLSALAADMVELITEAS